MFSYRESKYQIVPIPRYHEENSKYYAAFLRILRRINDGRRYTAVQSVQALRLIFFTFIYI